MHSKSDAISAKEKKLILLDSLSKLNQTLQISPNNSQAHFSKGNILSLLGNNLEALESYDLAIEIDDKVAEYHYNKGVILSSMQHHQDAILSLENAIKIHPNYSKAHSNLGSIKYTLGQYEAALKHFIDAACMDRDNLDALVGKCKALSQLKRIEEANNQFTNLVKKYPEDKKILENFANFCIELKRFTEAEELLKKVTDLFPDSHVAWRLLGDTQFNLDDLDGALQATKKSLDLKMDCADAHFNLGVIYKALDNQKMSELSFETALSHDQNHKLSHINLAPIYLGQFRFPTGWQEYKWRWTSPLCDSPVLNTNNPLWDGSRQNKKLFIWAEQGLGDQILYGSLLQLLVNYPGTITVSLDNRLIPSFQRLHPKLKFIDQKLPLDDADFDLQIPIADLGSVLVNSIEMLDKRRPPFISSNLALTDAIRDTIKVKSKLICGISWKSINKNIGASKSLSLNELTPILKDHRFNFINLQHGDVLGEIEELEKIANVKISSIDGLDLFNDIDGLISTIDACDLIITTSNSTAHLAGALNKETYLIIPKTKGKLWYWHDRNGKSPWYPSVKIYAQDLVGSWSWPIKQIIHDLWRKFEH